MTYEISNGAKESREKVILSLGCNVLAFRDLSEALENLKAVADGTGSEELRGSVGQLSEALIAIQAISSQIAAFSDIINPYLGRAAEVIEGIPLPDFSEAPPVDSAKYRAEPETGSDQRKFSTQVIPLNDPDVLYIETQGGEISGEIAPNEEGVITATVDIVTVEKEQRGQGKGRQLVEEFVKEAINRGAERLDSAMTSEIAMRNRIRIFGANNLIIQGEEDIHDRNDERYADTLIERTNDAVTISVDLTDPSVQAKLFEK